MEKEPFVITSPIEKKLILNFRKKLKKGRLLKCPKKDCGHVWVYGGKSKKYTSCPKCLSGVVHVERHRVKDT